MPQGSGILLSRACTDFLLEESPESRLIRSVNRSQAFAWSIAERRIHGEARRTDREPGGVVAERPDLLRRAEPISRSAIMCGGNHWVKNSESVQRDAVGNSSCSHKGVRGHSR
ncbi:hypothetical protein AAFF_G00185070 [Aldrovandia affinis]|uniref:Uncharacterized protein n=1 Tax=Aldrovandia affinis TaxID=143900 RepID=A0AAD7RJM3_9TELE|nr:hypothetical protein AAFF_G00185070 [Aldrovandia affinis]